MKYYETVEHVPGAWSSALCSVPLPVASQLLWSPLSVLGQLLFFFPVHHRQINGPMYMINTQLTAIVTHLMSLTTLKLV